MLDVEMLDEEMLDEMLDEEMQVEDEEILDAKERGIENLSQKGIWIVIVTIDVQQLKQD